MKTYEVLILAVFILTLGCSGSNNTKAALSQVAAKSLEPANPSPTDPSPANSSTDPSIQNTNQNSDQEAPAPTANPDSQEQASAFQNGCINLGEDPVIKKYRDMGVEIVNNCPEGITSSEVNAQLKALDESSSLFVDWKNKPTTIRLGGGAYHSSKEKVIQLPIASSKYDDYNNFLENSKTLMNFEQAEFNGEVRVDYLRYHLAKKPDGTMVDQGTGAFLSMDAKVLEADLQSLKKYKAQILAHKKNFDNIVLYHGNQFGLFQIDDWDRSYTFASETPAADSVAFFNYLTKYESVKKLYKQNGLDFTVVVTGYPDTNFRAFNQVLEVASHITDVVLKTQATYVFFTREVSFSTHSGPTLMLNGKTLRVSNMVDASDRVPKAADLRACIEKADFAKGKVVYCQE